MRTIELDVKFYFEVPDTESIESVEDLYLSIEGPEVMIEMVGEDSIPVDAIFTGWETLQVWETTEVEPDPDLPAIIIFPEVLRDCDD